MRLHLAMRRGYRLSGFPFECEPANATGLIDQIVNLVKKFTIFF